jgi:secreted trypsin-like serine protease
VFLVISTKPKYANIEVVDFDTCVRSHNGLIQITSKRTFCAGNRQTGTGACNGDSGGGLVVENNGKWYLRGIVSASLLDGDLCDTKNYAVYTDVTKFNGWIQGFVQQHG